MEITFPKVAETNVSFGKSVFTRNMADRYKAIVNPEDGHLYGIVGRDYKVIPHAESFALVEEALKEMPEYGTPDVSAKFINNGSRMICDVKFPEAPVMVGTNNDMLDPKITVFNSYDGSWRYQLAFGAFRLVCTNGLIIGERVLQVNKKHTKNFNVFYILDTLKKGMENFSNQKKIWDTWYDKQISLAEAQKKIEEIEFGKKEQEAINKEVEISSGLMLMARGQQFVNLWQFYCLLTQIVTHFVQSEMRRRELSFRVAKAFQTYAH